MVLTKFDRDCKILINSYTLAISHPLHFDQYQKSVLKGACKIAGISLIKLVPESTALS